MAVTFPFVKRYWVVFRHSDTGLTPSFTYYKRADTLADVVPQPTFVELSSGSYYFDVTFTTASDPDLIFEIDGGVSIPTEEIRYKTDMLSPKDIFVDAVVSQLITNSPEITAATASLANITSMLTRALGMMHENSVLDQTVFDGDNNLTSGRFRIYNSKANAVAAGVTGLVGTYTITASYTLSNLTNYTVVREP